MPSASAQELAKEAPLNFVQQPHWTEEHKQRAQEGFDRFARSREPPYRQVARSALRRDFSLYARTARAILQNERSGRGPSQSKDITEESVREFIRRARGVRRRRAEEWLRRYQRLHRRTTEIVVADINGELGLALTMAIPGIAREVRRRAEQLADQVSINNFRAVVHQVREGLDAGENRRQVTSRIMQIHDEGLFARVDGEGRFVSEDEEGERIQVLSARQRARLIARTETTAMANGAAVTAVAESRVDKWKDWISQRDSRVRLTHNNSVGEDASDPVPIDETFPVTGLPWPMQPNCRCTILFVDPPSKE